MVAPDNARGSARKAAGPITPRSDRGRLSGPGDEQTAAPTIHVHIHNLEAYYMAVSDRIRVSTACALICDMNGPPPGVPEDAFRDIQRVMKSWEQSMFTAVADIGDTFQVHE